MIQIATAVDYKALIFAVLRKTGNWRGVAEALAQHGHNQTCAAWHRVAHGQIRLSHEGKNALRSWAEMPPLPDSAAMVVASNSVTRVSLLDKRPNIALLARIDEGQEIVHANLFVEVAAIDVPQLPQTYTVTRGYRPPARRRRRKVWDFRLPVVDTATPPPRQITHRGKTVNFEALRASLRCAASVIKEG